MNNCPNCNGQIEPTDKFCPFCGEKINKEEVATPEVTEVKDEKDQEVIDVETDKGIGNTNVYSVKKKISKKSVLIGAIVALACFLFILGANKFVSVSNSPDKAVEKFFKSMQKGEYEAAYDYLADVDDNTLSKEYFINARKEMEKHESKIKDFQIKSSGHQDGKEYQSMERIKYVVSVVTQDNKEEAMDLSLINDNGKWKIMSPKLYSRYTLRIPYIADDMKILFNDKEVQNRKDYIKQYMADSKYYMSIPAFTGTKLKITITSEDIKPATVEFGPETKDTQDIKYEISDVLIGKAKDLINLFNTAYIEAQEARSMKPYESYVLKDSSLWDRLETDIDLSVTLNRKYIMSLDEIRFETFEFSGERTVKVKTVETWSGKRISTLTGEETGVFDPETNTNHYWLEKQENGSWLLVR